jgi:hypothetical protein
MVFNATFNNISVISWRSILLVEDINTEYPFKTTDLSQVTDKLHDIIFLVKHFSCYSLNMIKVPEYYHL